MTVNQILNLLENKTFVDSSNSNDYHFTSTEIRRNGNLLTKYFLVKMGNKVIINCSNIYINALDCMLIQLLDDTKIILHFESSNPSFWIVLKEVKSPIN
jgi:hypothetical protein